MNSISAKTVAVGQMIGNFATQVVTKTASSLTEFLKDVVLDSYADYEQLVGGIETLFGTGGRTLEEYQKKIGDTSKKSVDGYNRLVEAQNLMMENAEKAYKTSGLSMNEYMQQATTLSASLIKSLRGDTYNAAIYTDMAMQDMSDNANKFGTSIESIQNAYAGFAKQNYTMLDNLKLGYAGTKDGMESLLADAMKISGRKFNLESLADIIEAIHVIQENMDVTGTTAREAEGTISGSIGMMKAAWENLKIALADPKADINARIKTFADSFKSVVKNLFPVFKRVLKSIWSGVKSTVSSLPKIIFGENIDGSINWPTWDDVKTAVNTGWDTIVSGVKGLTKIVFGENVDGSVKWPTWDDIGDTITTAWTVIKDGVKNLAKIVFGENVDGSVKWPTWDEIGGAINTAWQGIVDGVKNLGTTIGKVVFGENVDRSIDWPTWTGVQKAITDGWATIVEGVAGLSTIVFGDKIDITSISSLGELLTTIQTGWNNLKDTVTQGAINIATYFFGDADPTTVSSTIKTIGDVLEAVGVAIVTYFTVEKVKGIISFFKDFRNIFTTAVGNNKLGLILAGIAAAITLIIENWDKIEPVIGEVGTWLQDNLITPITDFVDAIKQAITAMGEFLGMDTSGWFAGDKGSLPKPTGTPVAASRNTARLDINQINSLGAMRQLVKENPNARFVGTDGVTREAGAAFKKTFEDTLRASGFSDTLINKFSNGIENLSDSGFKDLMDALSNAQGYYDEFGNKLGGLSESFIVAGSSTNSLATAAANAANELNSIEAPDFGESPGHAKGLWSVPYDDYVARLHRGETVLTASQARRYRDGGNSVDLSSLGDIVREAISAGMQGATVRSYISGRDVTDDVNRNTIRQLKARRFAT